MNTVKIFGFTLAEVLITLGIIGIIAAMTLPTVVGKYQKKSAVVKLKRTYSLILQAFQMAEEEYGEVKYWDFSLSSFDFVKRYLMPYFSVLKSYQEHEKEYDVYCIDRSLCNSYFGYLSLPRIVLNDGVMLSFQYQVDQIVIVVDLNAEKLPNTFGKDLFAFSVQSSSPLLPYGVGGLWGGEKGHNNREWLMNGETRSCAKGGAFCAGVIMMDNWEMKSDYPW